jgi:S-disulfanyl-L-cysteine oxidoreductase SoxD
MPSSLQIPRIFLLAVTAASVAAAARITAQEPLAAGHAVRNGQDTVPVYSDSQATAGQAVWGKQCAECHETKDVTGGDFRTKWAGQPVFSLFEQIRTTMPDGDPGSLPAEDYAAALAYIFKLNGLAPGAAPFTPDSAALATVKLVLPPAPPSY